jgi:two-component system, NtrC family, sensor histidine kinase HydH
MSVKFFRAGINPDVHHKGIIQQSTIPHDTMDIFQPKNLYLPALIIVAIILTLLVFIGFSTHWNMDRARDNALKFVHQQGVATLQIIDASLLTLIETPDLQKGSVDQLIRKAGNSQYIEFVYIADRDGRIMHSSASLPEKSPEEWIPNASSDKNIFYRVKNMPDNMSIYEMAQKIIPYDNNETTKAISDPQSLSGVLATKKEYENAVLVVGLEMSSFEMAQHEDFHHAIIMVSILVVLGAGTIFFTFVIHLYHRMNRRLRETQEYTRYVVESMASGLLSIDGNGNVLSYNNLALEFIGQSSSDMDRFNLQQVIDFQQSGISKTLTQCAPVFDQEILMRKNTGEKMPLAISVTPMTIQEGTCQGAVIILRDLREIKRLEEKVRRAEKYAEVGKLAAAVAHEIRNPLSSIRGFAKFLSHKLQDRPQDQEYATIMVKEVDRINHVVTDLLNFARPLDTEPSHVNPVDLIRHTVRLVESDAGSRNINILEKTENSPETVFLDSDQMTQVLLNLTLNSLHEASAGQTIEIGVSLDEHQENVLFWVEDDGPGIPKANLERIFDPFFTTREKGTGLGLAIVQKIVENHHGRISVKSPLTGKDHGCRFVVTIPMDLEATS